MAQKSLADRKTIQKDLSQRNTEELAQRLFYALYPDENEIWQAPANRHFKPGSTVYARRLYPLCYHCWRLGGAIWGIPDNVGYRGESGRDRMRGGGVRC